MQTPQPRKSLFFFFAKASILQNLSASIKTHPQKKRESISHIGKRPGAEDKKAMKELAVGAARLSRKPRSNGRLGRFWDAHGPQPRSGRRILASEGRGPQALFTADEGEVTAPGLSWAEAGKPNGLEQGTLWAVPLSVTRKEENTSNRSVSLSPSRIQTLYLENKVTNSNIAARQVTREDSIT